MRFKNLRVVFDLDEVGRRFVEKTIEVYRRVHPDWKCPKFEDITDYNMSKFFDERADVYEFFTKIKTKEIFEEAEIEEGFKETLKYIKSLGHTVIIATHNDGQRAISTNIWLGRNEIEFSELFFTGEKHTAHGHIYFDDAAHNLENIKKHQKQDMVFGLQNTQIKTPLLYAYDKPWNRGNWKGNRVHNMKEIRELFRREEF